MRLYEIITENEIEYISKKYAISFMIVNSLRSKFGILPKHVHYNRNLTDIYIKHKPYPLEAMTSKMIYKIIIKNKIQWPTSREKWETRNNTSYSNIQWEDIYANCLKLSTSLNECDFRFKYIHRIIYTQDKLNYSNLASTDKCTMCNMHVREDIDHAFISCEYNNNLIPKTIEWLNNHLNINQKYNRMEQSVGKPNLNDNKMIDIYNRTIWLSKFFIYKKRKEKEEINLYNFLYWLANTIRNEYDKFKYDEKNSQWNSIWKHIAKYLITNQV